MEKQITRLLFFIFFNFLVCQDLISTREIVIYKNFDDDIINFSEYIDIIDGNYEIYLSDITSFNVRKSKKTLVSNCDLKLSLNNLKKTDKKVLLDLSSKGISAEYCSDKFESSNKLIIDKINSIIDITSHKGNIEDIECEFIFWIKGKFKAESVNHNKSNHGMLREWHDNGELFIEYTYENGKKNGPQRRWYDNGQQEILYYYKMGKLNGLQKKWYFNGVLKSKMNFTNDQQNGKSEEWFTDGSLKYTKFFENGVLTNQLNSN